MDKFYDADHPGREITDPKEQHDTRKSGTFQGFFLADDLLEFFPKPGKKKKEPEKECVGIRIYNAGGIPEAERRLIAVGVNFKGEEFSPSNNRAYLASSTAQLNVENMQKVGATHAVWQAKAVRTKKGDKERITFASFFSRKMIKTLLDAEAGQTVDGISFYIVPRDLKNTHGGHTHLGIAAKLVRKKPRPAETTPGGSPRYIASVQTCPDYCIAPAITIEAPANARSTTGTYVQATQPIIPNERYLNVWD